MNILKAMVRQTACLALVASGTVSAGAVTPGEFRHYNDQLTSEEIQHNLEVIIPQSSDLLPVRDKLFSITESTFDIYEINSIGERLNETPLTSIRLINKPESGACIKQETTQTKIVIDPCVKGWQTIRMTLGSEDVDFNYSDIVFQVSRKLSEKLNALGYQAMVNRTEDNPNISVGLQISSVSAHNPDVAISVGFNLDRIVPLPGCRDHSFLVQDSAQNVACRGVCFIPGFVTQQDLFENGKLKTNMLVRLIEGILSGKAVQSALLARELMIAVAQVMPIPGSEPTARAFDNQAQSIPIVAYPGCVTDTERNETGVYGRNLGFLGAKAKAIAYTMPHFESLAQAGGNVEKWTEDFAESYARGISNYLRASGYCH